MSVFANHVSCAHVVSRYCHLGAVLHVKVLTCSEIDKIMERATVWKIVISGSWRWHNTSPGSPRKRNKLKQPPIKLSRARKVRTPPEAFTSGVPRWIRNTIATDTWHISSARTASIMFRASFESHPKISKIGGVQLVLRSLDHWRSGHLVHWMSSRDKTRNRTWS